MGSHLTSLEANVAGIQGAIEREKRNIAEAKFGTVYQGGQRITNSDGSKVKTNSTSGSNSDRPIEYYSSKASSKHIRTNLNVKETSNKKEVENKRS